MIGFQGVEDMYLPGFAKMVKTAEPVEIF